MQNRYFALAFRVGALIFTTVGVLAQLGVFKGYFSASSFMYYTMQSNLLVIIMFAMLVVKTAKSLKEGTHGFNGWYARFEMICVITILITFIVYWTLLTPTVSPEYLWSFENLAVHGITPLLCLADYMLFTKGGHLKYKDIYYSCIYPLSYVGFSAIAGLAGYVYGYTTDPANPLSSALVPVRAPYFFLDHWSIGAWTAVYIIVILAFFILIAHGFYFIDKRRRKD